MLLLLVLPFVAGAQPIVLQLPRRVEKKANKWIRTLTEEAAQQVYFRLGAANNPNSDYELYCCTDLNNNTVWSRYAINSNLFLAIDNHLYPVCFDFDEYYALDIDQVLDPPGSPGCRDGLVRRRLSIFHGSTITIKQKDTFHRSHKRGLPIVNHFQPDLSLIVYFINDKVETSIYNYLKDMEKQNAYVILSQMNGVKQLRLAFFEKNESLVINETLASRTNRFLLVGDDRIPLIPDYVFIFGANIADDILSNKPSLVLECR